ncbi:MAG: dihydrouridine synthase [Candidatus Dactylopiibacterium carminicum]|uniref:tRNA-dihydrouridine(16) synthase n=2 Tax=Candidatus Dactylopiibacterium carminicum TaxID=857335 RepID=A0A272EYV5_9RHOO|nr:dihydrouridine synthase [Candidatus Dactylopiibacterium carminicum]PAS94207.1 MAG: dihydrouridine synthase [Candidatus Dactylopiibacterium carminicum]PAS95216.1 MAG: dihydrouridine synthase [Candidatus Dactylopiibacterium carminicum]
MEGLVDASMRDVLTRASHYDWCVTEFARISASVPPARFFTRIAPELLQGACTASGTPVRVQLLGSDPERLGASAARLAALAPAGIDLNFGCPAPTVNRHRGGSVLLAEPDLLFRIMRAVASGIAGRIPLTAKMRLGISDYSPALEAAQALVEGGAELLVVHARTKAEAYRPPAHWHWVARVAEAVNVPVVANGEVWSVADWSACKAASGVPDVMLGRGAVADPLLPARLRGDLPEQIEPGDWLRLWPLLAAYWQEVMARVQARHAPGRLKQWLNLLRRNYPQAEVLYQAIRPLRHSADVDAAMSAARPV